MTKLYQSTIKHVGELAEEALADNMMILFGEMAPADAAEYCFIHSHDSLKGNINVGGTLRLGSNEYPITAVGEVVNKNLSELGHITIRFDSLNEAEYPGCLHVSGSVPHCNIGETISFS
ncbi:PTS glucitol/sorbitol transporter subunit IIA [Vibrio mediterranei]|uniref:PTS glucitol/sorbitol transporter subunit IIA n=1 Tax=Vibrio mediterranei TaxID=689 RepID=UPI001EFE296E|nr:PTS glucitol/sorbitol transporter subunit IIA [Vibrio mediterranei]MCG9624379.1 PTS glucitol/sorbitol transporter subunit IIA [Vibrio mediterranei]MCG9659463.1 PTS glucitol/sorbitol transporter subunit IIA [Vibrio mediterranei]MCG9663269.1 PTS glucitol/sorbitol transporter subunit IIA [Vibrio mediterranei]